MIPKIGHTAVDLVTGFKGVVIGRVEYITGCTQLLVQPRVDDKGVVPEARWIDEQRMDAIDPESRIQLDNSSTPGCDIPAPIR